MPSTAGCPGPVQHINPPEGDITLLESDVCCHISLTCKFPKIALFMCSLTPDTSKVLLPSHVCKAIIDNVEGWASVAKRGCMAEEHLSQSWLARSQMHFCCLLSARAPLAATAVPATPRNWSSAQLHATFPISCLRDRGLSCATCLCLCQTCPSPGASLVTEGPLPASCSK